MAKKIFIIGPVRDIGSELMNRIGDYVKKLEKNGCEVHWPARDTDQNDPIGLQICLTNGSKIFESDEIHIWFDPSSKGSLFDRAMLCSFLFHGSKKKIVIINQTDFSPTELFDLESEIDRARNILSNEIINLEFIPDDPGSLFTFGLFFGWTKILGLEKKLVVTNLEKLQPTPKKSFVNVILALLNQ